MYNNLYYKKNIERDAKKIIIENKIEKYEECIKDICSNFGKKWNKNIMEYFNKNKVLPSDIHFEQFINMLIIFYYSNKSFKFDTISKDIGIFFTEFSNVGYYFTENEALFCLYYGMFLPNFRVDINSKNYIKLINELKHVIIYGFLDVPDHYIDIINNNELHGLKLIQNGVNITQLKKIFIKNKPTRDHYLAFKNSRMYYRSSKRDIIRFFNLFNIY